MQAWMTTCPRAPSASCTLHFPNAMSWCIESPRFRFTSVFAFRTIKWAERKKAVMLHGWKTVPPFSLTFLTPFFVLLQPPLKGEEKEVFDLGRGREKESRPHLHKQTDI
jgi:hypothetical protein